LKLDRNGLGARHIARIVQSARMNMLKPFGVPSQLVLPVYLAK
jgi:hypothetical protein